MERKADPWKDLAVIDARAPRLNQVVLVAVVVTGLATGLWPLLGLMAAQLAVTVWLGRAFCLPCQLYFRVIQPRLGEGELEDARAPRFANLVGAVFLAAATAAFALGFGAVGFALAAMVGALALLGATTGLCVGCELYRLAARLRGVRGRAIDFIDLKELGVEPREGLVVQFTHPLCSDCQKLEARLSAEGRPVVRIDVSRQRALAAKYGVSLVPLAFALNAQGRVLASVR